MKTAVWIKQNMPSMLGKTVAISGATGGIGPQIPIASDGTSPA